MKCFNFESETGKFHLETLNNLIAKNGPKHQLDVALGELGELLTLIGRGTSGRDSLAEWIEEISDVLITVHQLAIMAGLDAVDESTNRRLYRLRLRLESGEITNNLGECALVEAWKERNATD